MPKNNIAVYSTSYDLQKVASLLAKELNLPETKENTENFGYLLELSDKNLAINIANSPQKPIVVDFLTKQMLFRLKNLSPRKELLAKALGLKNGATPKIIDGTAGMATDSFIIASLGFEITLLERSPIIHALIKDGIKRAKNHPSTKAAANRINLINQDGITFFANMSERPDIIYLDPMFPEKKKSAKPTKAMQTFQDILGNDLDADKLLNAALTCARKRVVVKRPRLGATIENIVAPSFTMQGSSSRFDIYIIKE